MGRAIRSTAPVQAPRLAYRRALGYRAKQVLELIHAHVARHGHSPSYEMIAIELGFSDSSRVAHCIVGLERCGLVQRTGSRGGRGTRRIALVQH